MIFDCSRVVVIGIRVIVKGHTGEKEAVAVNEMAEQHHLIVEGRHSTG